MQSCKQGEHRATKGRFVAAARSGCCAPIGRQGARRALVMSGASALVQNAFQGHPALQGGRLPIQLPPSSGHSLRWQLSTGPQKLSKR